MVCILPKNKSHLVLALNPNRAIVLLMTFTESSLLSEVETLRANETVMGFVVSEALAQTATDIQKQTGVVVTPDEVKHLALHRADIRTRMDRYTALGLVACLAATHSA